MMKILLVEKDEHEHKQLVQLFDQVKQHIVLQIDVIHDEEQITSAIQHTAYNCMYITLDLAASTEGKDLSAQVKTWNKQLPVVILLANDQQKNDYQEVISQAQGYLSKNQLNPANILASLQPHMNNSSHKDLYLSNHLKQGFLSDMGHELRTPMSAILGFSSLLMQSNLNESQYKFAQSIHEATHNLLSIINDVLDYSKIEASKLHIEKNNFNLRQLLHKVKQRCAQKNNSLQPLTIELSIDEQLPDFLKSDQDRVSQILCNLISETAKFTASKDIGLSAHMLAYKERQIHLQFEIKATNAQVSSEQVNALFDSLNYLGVNHFQRVGDTGLGLVIVKKLVKLLGGNVAVKHHSDTGISLVCELSMEVGQATEKANVIPDEEVQLDNVKVLVCEDNILSQELTKEILHRLGWQVDIADNGKIGVEKLQNEQAEYDVVLMDIQMPEMNGIEATSAIRELEHKTKDIPVIALTAQSVTDEKNKYFDAGITDYLTKPFTPDDITQMVLKYLPKRAKETNGTNTRQTTQPNVSHTLFDLNFLRDAFGDNPVIFQELLQLLTSQFLKFKQEVSNGLYMKNWKAIANAAQTIKTNLRAFGLKSLENKVILIEEYASKQENVAHIPELIRDCEDIFAGAIKELNSLLEDENNTQGKHLHRKG